MKPFDLEKALAGDPVVTRDGRPVYQLKFLESSLYYKFAGVLEEDIDTWTIDGKNILNEEGGSDLFMEEKTKKKLWIMIRKNGDVDGHHETSHYAYPNKNEDRFKNFDKVLYKLIEIEI